MKIDTRLAFLSLLVGIGSLIVGIKQCQFAENPVDTNKKIKDEKKEYNSGPKYPVKAENKEQVNSSRQSNKKEFAKTDKQMLQKYFSRIKNENGNGVSNAEVYCPNCITKTVITDINGGFILEGYFDENTIFWKSSINISKYEKTITETIDWREMSPQPIIF